MTDDEKQDVRKVRDMLENAYLTAPDWDAAKVAWVAAIKKLHDLAK